MKQFKHKLTLATQIHPLIAEDTDKYLALASKSNLKDFLPKDVDFDKKIDFLGFSGEFCTVNRLNGNDDAIQTEQALEIVKLLPFSFIDTEHDRKSIVGVITSAHFNEFKSNKVLSEADIKDRTTPFNITIAGIIWRLINPELSQYIEASGDPDSDNHDKIFLSWELLFDKANLIEIDPTKKNTKDGKIISDASAIEALESKLKANGGKGYTDSGKRLGRIPIDEIIPAGCALTENPAGEDLRPITILTSGENIKETDSNASMTCEASIHHVVQCDCGQVISQCRCNAMDKKLIIKEGECLECKARKGDFKGFSDTSTKEAYSDKPATSDLTTKKDVNTRDKAEEIKNTPIQQNVKDIVKNETKSTDKVETVNEKTNPFTLNTINTTNKDIPPKHPNYKFGKCPNCGGVSDYNSFIKRWNSSEGVIHCESCTKNSLAASWEFNEVNIWHQKTADNVATEKKQKITATNESENKMSHLETTNVNKDNTKHMKISSITDITDENLKECKASDIHEIVTTELQKISDKYVVEKTERDNLVKSTKEQFETSNANLENARKEIDKLKTDLAALVAEKETQAKLAIFSNRMSALNDKFELNDKEREILGSKVKGLDKDEDFNKFLEETEILLAAKKKMTKADDMDDDCDDDDDDDKGGKDNKKSKKSKKNMKASQEDTTNVANTENTVQNAVENGKKAEIAIANTTSGSSPSLAERMKTAFGQESWSVEGINSKRKNRF